MGVGAKFKKQQRKLQIVEDTMSNDFTEVFQHFKGGYYLFLGLAKHHDSGDPWVVYRSLETKETYCREYADFLADVYVPERGKVSRFKQLRSAELTALIEEGKIQPKGEPPSREAFQDTESSLG